MGGKKQTQTTEIAPRTGQETDIMALLQRLATGAEGQLGDLSGLAGGEVGASAADRRLIEESIGASTDIARRGAERSFRDASSLVEETAIGRGIGGSSIEAVNQAVLGGKFQDVMADVASRGQQQESEALLSLPFQRAGLQLNANQLLLQQLTGGANPLLSHNLQERLAQTTTTQEQPFGFGEALNLGIRGGSAIASGGTSEVANATP